VLPLGRALGSVSDSRLLHVVVKLDNAVQELLRGQQAERHGTICTILLRLWPSCSSSVELAFEDMPDALDARRSPVLRAYDACSVFGVSFQSTFANPAASIIGARYVRFASSKAALTTA
jgi:hypothetical protein